MGDLKDPRLMWLKAVLFVLTGTIAAALILVASPTAQTAFLLAIVIWSFARAYYFAFYVVQHYIDDRYRFAGLADFAAYAWRTWRARGAAPQAPREPGE